MRRAGCQPHLNRARRGLTAAIRIGAGRRRTSQQADNLAASTGWSASALFSRYRLLYVRWICVGRLVLTESQGALGEHMVKIHGYYEYDDDSLTPGQAKDGGLSQLLFDSERRLSDHASFHPEDPDDDDECSYDSMPANSDSESDTDAQATALLILAVIGAATGGYVLIRKATPHVQRMINERALPVVRTFWKKVRRQGREADVLNPDETSAIVTQTPPEHEDAAAAETDVAVAKPQMSPNEWHARFRAMFEARQFADEQWKLLSSVQVADDGAIAELQREMARNRPEAVVRQVTLMLKATPEIDADAEAALMPVEVGRDPGQRS